MTKRFGLILVIFIIAHPGSAWACPFEKGTYQLIEDSAFLASFLPPSSESGVQVARVQITHRGDSMLKGYVTASQGFSRLYLVPDNASLKEANIPILPLDKDLGEADEDAYYVVMADLPSQMYYANRDLWQKHPLVGAVWRRIACK